MAEDESQEYESEPEPPVYQTFSTHLVTLRLLEVGGQRRSEAEATGKVPRFNVVGDPLIRNGSILKSAFMSDVVFIVGTEKVSIEAHKFMLASTSEVFYTMFYGSLPERNAVVIPDGDSEAFSLMLDYIYMGVVPERLSAELVMEVFDLARKYMLDSYEHYLNRTLMDSITPENALFLLSNFILYDLTEVEKYGWGFIEVNMRLVVKTEDFLKMDPFMLSRLVRRDGLCLTEMELFDAVVEWGRAECERLDREPHLPFLRRVLRPILAHIRFPTMWATTFSNGPGRSGLLEKEDVGEILLYICCTSAIKPPCKWPTTPRPYSLTGGPPADPYIVPSYSSGSEMGDEGKLYCECNYGNPNCFFCFGRKKVQVQQSRASAMLSAGIPSPINRGDRTGRGRAPNSQRPYSVTLPQAYCPCRTRGACPGKPQPQQTEQTSRARTTRSTSTGTPGNFSMQAHVEHFSRNRELELQQAEARPLRPRPRPLSRR